MKTEVLKKHLDNLYEKSIPFKDLVKMAEFVLKNYYFEFNSNVKHQISGAAFRTKSAPPYTGIYMDYPENQFLKNEQIQPWIWFMYINDTFFIWTASEKELDDFLERFNNFHLNLRFSHELLNSTSISLNVTLKVNQGEFTTDL